MYKGFRFVGSMASIYEQRVKKRVIVEPLIRDELSTPGMFLDIGVGDGRDLEIFLGSEIIRQKLSHVWAIDIEDWFTPEISILPNLSKMDSQLKFELEHAEHITRCFDAEKFDIVQCSFLFHELLFGKAKEQSANGCFHVLKRGGFLIYSDMFLDNQLSENLQRETDRQETIRQLYGQYLKEADEALQEGRLTKEQWEMLCGNNKPGLLKSMEEALSGKDGFYETLGQCIDRLLSVGFVRLQVYPNRLNNFLYIIIAQKPTKDIRNNV
jgi:ubiquinone/menaquinone biosynthesis C-methylase UbiE